jgi:hypothetical protein
MSVPESDGIFAELNWFSRDDNHRFVRRVLKHVALNHPITMMEVVNCARAGWGIAVEALEELILEFDDRSEELPTYLRAYRMDLVRHGRPRLAAGAKTTGHFLRDIAVAALVGKTADEFGLKPTRENKMQRHVSACKMVANALHMSEPSVVAIWTRLGRVAFPNGVGPARRAL